MVFDDEGNGVITRAELLKMLKANHMAMNDSEVSRKADTIMVTSRHLSLYDIFYPEYISTSQSFMFFTSTSQSFIFFTSTSQSFIFFTSTSQSFIFFTSTSEYLTISVIRPKQTRTATESFLSRNSLSSPKNSPTFYFQLIKQRLKTGPRT